MVLSTQTMLSNMNLKEFGPFVNVVKNFNFTTGKFILENFVQRAVVLQVNRMECLEKEEKVSLCQKKVGRDHFARKVGYIDSAKSEPVLVFIKP